jgi:hypothetical protein
MAQFNTSNNAFQSGNKTLFEVNQIASNDGNPIDRLNPFPTSIHSAPGGVDVTSKNRMKVSPYQTVFFNTFQYGLETDIWDEQLTNGGTATHNPNTNNIDMAVSGTQGSKVIRQTKAVMRYIPGRTSTLTYAIRLQTPVTGIRRRFGMFEEENGAYFEDAGVMGANGLPEYNVVIRSKTSGSVVENRIPRSQWNGDKLDGTGPSGIVADPDAQHMVNIEYEWYGAGQVAFGFVINGLNRIIHTFNHGNIIDLPWASTPFLPIRLELENLTGVAGTHYLYQGSNSLISEGEPEKLGIAQSVASPFTGTTMAVAQSWYPILSLRLKAGALKGIMLPRYFQVATSDNANIFYRIAINPVIPSAVTVGQNGPQPWVDIQDPNSFVQYQTYIAPAAITEANHGRLIDSGFIITGGGGARVRVDEDAAYQLSRSSLGTVSDVITILASSDGANKAALAAMTWIEQR